MHPSSSRQAALHPPPHSQGAGRDPVLGSLVPPSACSSLGWEVPSTTEAPIAPPSCLYPSTAYSSTHTHAMASLQVAAPVPWTAPPATVWPPLAGGRRRSCRRAGVWTATDSQPMDTRCPSDTVATAALSATKGGRALMICDDCVTEYRW